MDSKGNIVPVADDAEAKRRNLIYIPEGERSAVQAMSVKERIEWFHSKLRERTHANRVERRRKKRDRKSARKARRRLRASMKRR